MNGSGWHLHSRLDRRNYLLRLRIFFLICLPWLEEVSELGGRWSEFTWKVFAYGHPVVFFAVLT